ncbi:hypothetical protein HCN44_003808 [Aphidius gifuensis]|uniref:F-box domain-containing protein n=1 Tax=Aphidius gifuensis TaxID=684658 RepID=A0A834Y0L6_APHGI|nr:F-box protein SKIP2-like [Aphidius gifuensis]KAF7994336.1 hypothetical protein HCN44_003808 [Aphidius gifuensis]
MSRICSICLSESSNRATPLYSKHGNIWTDTGLSEMVKSCNDIKIKKATDTCALHVICNTCIYKTCLSYFKNDDSKLSSSSSSLTTSKIEPLLNIIPSKINKRKEKEQDSWPSGSIDNSINKYNRHELSSAVSPDSTNQNNDFPNKRKYYRDQKYYVPPSSSLQFINKNNFIKINDDCLAKIFMNLSIEQRLDIERVCQKWKHVARSLAWSDIQAIDTNSQKFSHIFKHQNDVEKIILRCGSKLTFLNINKLCESSIIYVIKKYCINLKNLILHLDNYDEQDFVNAFKHMANLQSIEIKFKDLVPKTLPISSPRLLQSVNKDNIENIIVSSFWIDSSRTIYYPAPSFEKFGNLRFLKITACYLDKDSLEDISKCKKLINLELIRCKISENNLFISQLPNLKSLQLIQSGCNIDDFLIDLRYESRYLEHLDIGGTTSVSSKALSVLSKFRRLKYLDIGLVKNVDDNLIIKISNECKNLKYLNIRECCGVSETAIKYLIKKCDYLGKIDASMTGHSLALLVATAKIIKKRKTNNTLKFVSRSSLITRFYRLKNAASFLSPILEFSHHPDDEEWGYDYNYDYQDEYDSNDSDDSNGHSNDD